MVEKIKTAFGLKRDPVQNSYHALFSLDDAEMDDLCTS